MRWHVEENEPDLIGHGYIILLDGEPVPRVTSFDTEEGWVEALCLDGHRCWENRDRPPGKYYETPQPGDPHISPDNPERVCEAPRRHGHVQLLPPGEGSRA